MNLENWVRTTLWLTAPFNLLAAYVFAFPSSVISRLLDLPNQPYNFYTLFTGGLVGLFGFIYLWIALQPSINRPLLAVGASGKLMAVLISLVLFLQGQFSGVALFVLSGDLLFAGFWFFWLVRTRGMPV